MKSQDIELTGKIAIKPLNSDSCFIYSNYQILKEFRLQNSKEISYGGVTWLNIKDIFIG